MNNGQRVQMHFLDNITFNLISIAFIGFRFQWIALGLGSAIILGRLLFSVGYVMKGPRGRMVGALLTQLSILASYIACIVTCVFLAIDLKDQNNAPDH